MDYPQKAKSCITSLVHLAEYLMDLYFSQSLSMKFHQLHVPSPAFMLAGDTKIFRLIRNEEDCITESTLQVVSAQI